jgi:predicted lipid-binding transport protein (Tim44 family)
LNLELIILAAIAVFVISRLYSVLGQKTGAEPPARRVRETVTRSAEPAEADAYGDEAPSRGVAFSGPAARDLEAIAAVDTAFSPDEFLRGARKAYEMIVEAFAEADLETLRGLLDQDVYDAYAAAIADRAEAGAEPLRLLKLRSAEIVSASLAAGSIARVSICFEADLSDGEAMRSAREIWTFRRSLRSDDPNWQLDEVEAAAD